jgi:Reverse transcriptase (RNA-dependent DNA polymerase)/Endonuclease-reverse transcriptase
MCPGAWGLVRPITVAYKTKRTTSIASERQCYGGQHCLGSAGPLPENDMAKSWKIGTWNIRGVKDKENELVNEMCERDLDVLCVCETKRKGNDVSTIDVIGSCKTKDVSGRDESYLALWSGVEPTVHGSKGVGLILSSKVKRMMRTFEMVSPRLMWVRMKVGILRVVIVACYAPVNGVSEEELNEFWGQLNDVLNACDKNERVIVLGDLNGWVGLKRNGVEDVVGSYGDPRVNENGERIVNMCLEYELFVSNTWFKHKSIHMYTRRMGDQKSMIDLILYDKRLKDKVMDTRVYRGAECGTDHFLVVSRVNLGEKWRARKKEIMVQKRVRIERLQNEEVRCEYTKKVNERMSGVMIEWEKKVVQDNDVEWGYKMVKEVCLTSAEEVCGSVVTGRKAGNGWWNEEVSVAVNEKKAAYMRMNVAKTEDERKVLYEVYKEKRKAAKMAVKKSKQEFRKKLEEKMMNDFISNIKLYWKLVKEERKGNTQNASGVKNVEGEIVWDESESRECWRKYFMELFLDGEIVERSESGNVNERVSEEDTWERDDVQKDMSMDELKKAMKKLKNGKAAGVDGVTSEMIKYGGAVLDVRLLQLMNACFKSGRAPEEWKCAVIVPLYKGKGDKYDCKNYRGISLLSVTGKLYGRMVIGRVQKVTQESISEVQCGFMPGRGCSDQIFTVQQLIEKCEDVGKKLFVAFVDLEKAYDRVNRSMLWSVLDEYGVKGRLLGAVKAMYEGSKACVRMNGGLSEWFEVSRGVRQGCVMSPWLFNIFMDKCIRMAESMAASESGIKMDLLILKMLLYADDAVVVAESAEELQSMLVSLEESTRSMDLKINGGKTKIMVFNGENDDANNVMLNGEKLERVNEFVYLGRMFQENGSLDGEINRRVQAGRRVVGAMAGLARSEVLSTKAKLAVYNSVLVPTMLYGSESWVCQEKHRSKVNAVGMSFLRSMCGKTRMDKVRNDWVMNECGVKEMLTVKGESNMLRWFGHVERMGDERIAKMVYKGKIEGRRTKGRPRSTWSGMIEKNLKKRNVLSKKNKRTCMKGIMRLEEASVVCRDRKEWRNVVRRS